MLANFSKRLAVAGLKVLKVFVYIVCAPFVAAMTLYGTYFVAIAFAWMCVLCAAIITSLLIFEANFFMFFAAIFKGDVWTTMGNMWAWLWSWFSDGNIALWPHFVKSSPIYFGASIIVVLLFQAINRINTKTLSTKKKFAVTP
jgi:hypothetical protein